MDLLPGYAKDPGRREEREANVLNLIEQAGVIQDWARRRADDLEDTYRET